MSGLQTSFGCQGKVEVTQINLTHCDTAQQLLCQSVVESNSDVAIISEPYRVPTGNANWIVDKTGLAAIWATG